MVTWVYTINTVKKKGINRMECGEIRAEYKDKVLTVTLSGEIDHHSAKGIREEIDSNIYFYRPEKLELDLSGIAFMDSSGLGLILGRYTRMKDLGGGMTVVNANREIIKILKLAGVDGMLLEKNTKTRKEYKMSEVKRERKELMK